MAKTKKENLKGMALGELTKKLASLQEAARVFRFKAQGSRSKNVKESAAMKKEIARVFTEINSQRNSQKAVQ